MRRVRLRFLLMSYGGCGRVAGVLGRRMGTGSVRPVWKREQILLASETQPKPSPHCVFLRRRRSPGAPLLSPRFRGTARAKPARKGNDGCACAASALLPVAEPARRHVFSVTLRLSAQPFGECLKRNPTRTEPAGPRDDEICLFLSLLLTQMENSPSKISGVQTARRSSPATCSELWGEGACCQHAALCPGLDPPPGTHQAALLFDRTHPPALSHAGLCNGSICRCSGADPGPSSNYKGLELAAG